MWVVEWVRRSLDDTRPSDDVIPPFAKVPLLGRWTGPLGFWSCRLDCGDALSAALARALALKEQPPPPSTLHSHGISLCGFPRSHSTQAYPAG